MTAAACATGSGDGRTRRSDTFTATAPAPLPALQGSAYDAAVVPALPARKPESHEGLHNVFELSSNVVSGGEPLGEKAFELLRAKGIRTILSVDGKVPDAAAATRHGMKYVHVPIQYKGIEHDALVKIAKTFREQPGPFYVHCFHGKHRGPAAAEVGRMVLDGVPRRECLAEMRQWCGTAQSYEGLYDTIAHAAIPDARETESLQWDFAAACRLDGVAGAMVQICRAHDHLEGVAKAGWHADPEHPDIDAAHESKHLASLFERASQLDLSDYGDDFRGWLRDARRESARLRDLLSDSDVRTPAADHALKALTATCSACHQVYRN